LSIPSHCRKPATQRSTSITESNSNSILDGLSPAEGSSPTRCPPLLAPLTNWPSAPAVLLQVRSPWRQTRACICIAAALRLRGSPKSKVYSPPPQPLLFLSSPLRLLLLLPLLLLLRLRLSHWESTLRAPLTSLSHTQPYLTLPVPTLILTIIFGLSRGTVSHLPILSHQA
jgi:hypothetical protein